MARGLLIGPAERARLAKLASLAGSRIVDVRSVKELVATREGRALHMAQMDRQTVGIPNGFLATYSIEDGHGPSRCHHLSVSIDRVGRVPHPEAVWAIAEELGFTGSMEGCAVWLEALENGGRAVNLVQPLDGPFKRLPAARAPDGPAAPAAA